MPFDKYIAIGKKIKLARMSLELTQTQLAKKINATQQTVGAIEKGGVKT